MVRVLMVSLPTLVSVLVVSAVSTVKQTSTNAVLTHASMELFVTMVLILVYVLVQLVIRELIVKLAVLLVLQIPVKMQVLVLIRRVAEELVLVLHFIKEMIAHS